MESRSWGLSLLIPEGRAKAGEGFDKASFLIDWEREVAICPEGLAELLLVAQWRSKQRSRWGHSRAILWP